MVWQVHHSWGQEQKGRVSRGKSWLDFLVWGNCGWKVLNTVWGTSHSFPDGQSGGRFRWLGSRLEAEFRPCVDALGNNTKVHRAGARCPWEGVEGKERGSLVRVRSCEACENIRHYPVGSIAIGVLLPQECLNLFLERILTIFFLHVEHGCAALETLVAGRSTMRLL